MAITRATSYSNEPIQRQISYNALGLTSAVDLKAAVSTASSFAGAMPRVVYVENSGDGTLVCVDGLGNTITRHSLESGTYLEPSPANLQSIGGNETLGNLSAFIIEDVGTGFTDDTTDANDVGTADVLMMPATEAAGDRGIIGFTKPFNAVTTTLSTAGVGSTMTWKYYTGDPVTYATASWSALSGIAESAAGAKNLLASGTVSWRVPDDWKPAVINSLGPYYYVAYELVGTYSTNPVGSQLQLLNKTTVGRVVVGW